MIINDDRRESALENHADETDRRRLCDIPEIAKLIMYKFYHRDSTTTRAGFECVEALGRIIIRGPYGFLLLIKWVLSEICLQCFDAVGWAAGRASGL